MEKGIYGPSTLLCVPTVPLFLSDVGRNTTHSPQPLKSPHLTLLRGQQHEGVDLSRGFANISWYFSFKYSVGSPASPLLEKSSSSSSSYLKVLTCNQRSHVEKLHHHCFFLLLYTVIYLYQWIKSKQKRKVLPQSSSSDHICSSKWFRCEKSFQQPTKTWC